MSNNNNILSEIYQNPDSKSILNLIRYLNEISGKELKLTLIRQFLFKYRWKKSEQQLIARCHIKGASKYLDHLLNKKPEIEKKEIQIIIADLTEYVQILDPNQNTTFILVSTNVLPSFIHFKHAQELFYNHEIRKDFRNNYSIDLLVLYSLRLTLEKRVNGILGIDYIKNKHGKAIGLQNKIKITKGLKNIEYPQNLKWDEIGFINDWLNHYMHRNIRPYPWIIHQAFDILDNLLGMVETKDSKSRSMSYYGSTIVQDSAKLDIEVKELIEENFPDSTVRWKKRQEILIK